MRNFAPACAGGGRPSITTRRAGAPGRVLRGRMKPMDASDVSVQPTPLSGAPRHDLAALLGPGVLTLDAEGGVRFADRRALELLGCAGGFELERLWAVLTWRPEAAG